MGNPSLRECHYETHVAVGGCWSVYGGGIGL